MIIRTVLFAAVLSLSATPLLGQQNENRFDAPARRHDYLTSLFSPAALLGVAASTALDQIRDDPPEWNFGDRALSNTGRLVLQTSLHHGIAAVMDRSTWYYPCTCTDTGERVVHALAEAFADHDRQGKMYFSVAHVGSVYGSAFAESAWRPHRSLSEAFMSGTSSLVGSSLLNLWREFATNR
ncbi:MAG TPA: hypothetical protein VF021_00680 [Longimicrobiales bacterium]